MLRALPGGGQGSSPRAGACWAVLLTRHASWTAALLSSLLGDVLGPLLLCRAVQDLQGALTHSGSTSPRDKPRHGRQELLCLVGKDEAQMRAGAAAAAAAGHEHTAILEGGLTTFEAADLAQVRRCAIIITITTPTHRHLQAGTPVTVRHAVSPAHLRALCGACPFYCTA